MDNKTAQEVIRDAISDIFQTSKTSANIDAIRIQDDLKSAGLEIAPIRDAGDATALSLQLDEAMRKKGIGRITRPGGFSATCPGDPPKYTAPIPQDAPKPPVTTEVFSAVGPTIGFCEIAKGPHQWTRASSEPMTEFRTCEKCGWSFRANNTVIVEHAPANPQAAEAGALDLEVIEARANAAVPGPWKAHAVDLGRGMGPLWRREVIGPAFFDDEGNDYCEVAEGLHHEGNTEFIAHARQDIPALIAEVRRLRTIEATPNTGDVK